MVRAPASVGALEAQTQKGMINRCVNLDWLEVYCIERKACDAKYFTDLGFTVQVRDYGTPMYSEMFTIYMGQLPFMEVRRKPYSVKSEGGIFADGSCHLRLSNRFCYTISPVDEFRKFILMHDYYYVGISRLDICLDFIKFDKNDDPRGFLNAYFSKKYAKINQCNISAHGTDRWQGQTWNSVKWGSPSSMVSTKMYLKTLEMQESGNKKAYIVDQWRQANLAEFQLVSYKDKDDVTRYRNVVVACVPPEVPRPDRNKAIPIEEVNQAHVWRVEFSIKTEGRHWIDLTNGRQIDLDLTTIDNRDKLLFIFHSLAAHYFHFKRIVKKADGSPQRKDRCPDKDLFVTSEREQAYRPKALSLTRDATRMDRMILHWLSDLANDWDHTTPEERRAAYLLIRRVQEEIDTLWGNQMAEEIKQRIATLPDYLREKADPRFR